MGGDITGQVHSNRLGSVNRIEQGRYGEGSVTADGSPRLQPLQPNREAPWNRDLK